MRQSQLLIVLSLVVMCLLPAPCWAVPPTLNTTTYWFGNSFSGDTKWVQLGISDIYVFPDGRVVTNTGWDEAGKAIGFYRNGDAIGKVDDWSALTGGTAVTADNQYLFALRAERKRKEEDPFWQGVARYTLDGKPATWPEGEGRLGNVLFLNPPDDKWTGALTGVAVKDRLLYLGDPVTRHIKVYSTGDMKLVREFALTPETDVPRKMLFDRQGLLWVVQRVQDSTYRIRQYNTDGVYQQREITDVALPAALCLDNKGLLLTADNGPNQQIYAYKIADKPSRVKAYGERGGVFAGTKSGQVGPWRFCGLTGVGMDAAGNLYVSMDGNAGGKGGGFGARLEAYSAKGKLSWALEGLEFVDSADFVPAQDYYAYSKDSVYLLDYAKQTGSGWPHAGWQHVAWTINPFKYPNDPRLHIRQEGVKVFRAQGRLFLSCMFGDAWTAIYRFQGSTGYTAIPAVMFSKGGPADFPPNNPFTGKAWMWVDANGDGDFQKEEFQALAPGGLDVFRAQYVDAKGTYWLGEQGTCLIHRMPITTINKYGVPVYTLDSRTTVKMKELAPDLQNIRDLKYVPDTDTMYMVVYSQAQPRPQEWVLMGRELRRYDHWSIKPELRYAVALPFDEKKGIMPISLAVAGDYCFVAFMNGSDIDHRVTGEILVYAADTGTVAGALRPTKEVGGKSGWIDFQTGAINAHLRDDGTYVVFAEEDARSKIIYYQWKPARN